MKRFLSKPYPYLFLGTFIGVYILWNLIRLPSHPPADVVSPLILVGYNPNSNILRFALLILAPPLVCLLYWLFTRSSLSKRSFPKIAQYSLIVAGLLLAVLSAMTQASTNPANNQTGEYGGPYSYAMLDTFHEGETLGSAISYLDPNLKPYKDFVVVHGVFQDPLRTVIAFQLFGQSIGAARAFAVILTIITMILCYLLFFQLFHANALKAVVGIGVLSVLMLPSGVVPLLGQLLIGVQFPFRDIATILFLMVAVWSLRITNKLESRSIRSTVVSSCLIGFIIFAGFANSIDRALYIAALGAVWLVLFLTIHGWHYFIKHSLLPLFVGSALGVVVLGLALKWEYVSFLQYLLTMATKKEYLDGIVLSRPTLAVSILFLAISATLLVAGLKYIKMLGKKQPISFSQITHTAVVFIRQYPVEILLFATSIFFLRSALGRTDMAHFNYVIQWFYVFAIYMLLTHIKLRKDVLQPALFWLLPALLGLIGWYVFAVKAINVEADMFPVNVPDTSFVRPDYLATSTYLKEHLSPSETFITLTSEGSWYYLVDKPSPTRYFVVWYAFLPEQKREINKEILENQKIKFIVTNDNWTSNIDYIPNTQRFPEIYATLTKLYAPTETIGQQTIWQRKNTY